MNLLFWRRRPGVSAPSPAPESSNSDNGKLSAETRPFGRFIYSDEDARGHVALSLFLLQQRDENEDLTLKQFAEIVSKSHVASTVYFPAGQRMLDAAFAALQDKEASREVQRSALAAEITRAVEERHQYVVAQIEGLKDKVETSLTREIIKVSVATLLVTVFVVLLSALPEPIGSLREGVQGLIGRH